MEPLATIFLFLIVCCGIAAVSVRDLLAAVIIFGAFSFFSAIYFTILGAVDVAFTEAVVGAAMSTTFLVIAVFRTVRRAKG